MYRKLFWVTFQLGISVAFIQTGCRKSRKIAELLSGFDPCDMLNGHRCLVGEERKDVIFILHFPIVLALSAKEKRCINKIASGLGKTNLACFLCL